MSVTEEIKNRLDIVNYITQFVPLKKTGRNYKAPCPFHAERTPSFVVFPETQNWRCFGACGEGGDIFNFVMKQEGLDFPAALRFLADKAGIQLQERTPEQANLDEHLDKLRGLLAETTRFFQEKLQNPQQPEADFALSYIRKRGFTDDTLVKFGIGFAPHDWRQALEHLTSLGYSEDDVIEAGVAIRNDNGRVYDRFRNRVVIPIRDGRGQVIGFGARALAPEDNPKYLNSPQTPLFDKGATLFGLDVARRAIRESETAVIVEGYMDAIQAHQAGFSNVVAQMGTALTDHQLKQLSAYARRLILALDPDIAGVNATMRGLEVARQTLGGASLVFDPRGIMRHASKLGIEILVITMPEHQDPDDLIRENPAAWRTLVENAQSVADYVINAGTAHLTPKSTFSDREQAARQLLPILVATENDLQQHYNIQRLALKLHLDEKLLIQWTQQHNKQTAVVIRPERPDRQQQKSAEHKAADPAQSKTVVTGNQAGVAIERRCLAMLIQRSDPLLYVANRKLREIAATASRTGASGALSPLCAEDFTRSDFRAIFSLLETALTQDDQEPLEYLRQHLPYELTEEVERLLIEPLEIFKQNLIPSMHAQLEAEQETARKKRDWLTSGTLNTETEVVQRVLELRKQRLRRENQDLQFLIQDAGSDSETEYNYVVKNNINRNAIRLIEQEIGRVMNLQREH